jgi:hypothetical protein
MTNNHDHPERPRYEPEIIPPGHSERQHDWHNTPWRNGPMGYTGTTQRVYMTRIGPFGIALMLLAIAAIVAIIVIAAVGALLIWIPVIAAVLVVGALFRLFRRSGPR